MASSKLIKKICSGDLSLIKSLDPLVRKMVIEETDAMRNSEMISSLSRDIIKRLIDINNGARKVEREMKGDDANLMRFIGLDVTKKYKFDKGPEGIIQEFSLDCKEITNNWERCIRSFNYINTEKGSISYKKKMDCTKECIGMAHIWFTNFIQSILEKTAKFSIDGKMYNGKTTRFFRISMLYNDQELTQFTFVADPKSLKDRMEVNSGLFVQQLLGFMSSTRVIPEMIISINFNLDKKRKGNDDDTDDEGPGKTVIISSDLPMKERWIAKDQVKLWMVSTEFTIAKGARIDLQKMNEKYFEERRKILETKTQSYIDNINLLFKRIYPKGDVKVEFSSMIFPQFSGYEEGFVQIQLKGKLLQKLYPKEDENSNKETGKMFLVQGTHGRKKIGVDIEFAQPAVVDPIDEKEQEWSMIADNMTLINGILLGEAFA